MLEPLPQKKAEDAGETLEFLKREEVRTMAKDIAQLREEETKKERERIAKIKIEEPSQPTPPPLMPHAQEQKPVFLNARTRSEKVLIRVVVIGVLLFMLLNGLAFGYWYFTRKKIMEIVPSPQSTSTTEPAPASPAEPATTT